MSITDEALKANETYAQEFKLGHLPMPPGRKLAIVACMDARLPVEQALGLKTGDALIISHHLLGTQEFIIINHTDCGMLTFKDHELTAKLEAKTNASAVTPHHFYAFPDLENNVRQQIQR